MGGATVDDKSNFLLIPHLPISNSLASIGTLLGRRGDDRTIEVTDCFGVPFLEKVDELYVAINKEYHKSMYAAQRRVSRKEGDSGLVYDHQGGGSYHRQQLASKRLLLTGML